MEYIKENDFGNYNLKILDNCKKLKLDVNSTNL